MTSFSEPPANVSAIDLERYASEAILPRMNFEDRPPRSSTRRFPNDQRKLKSVHRVSKKDFGDRVTSYCKTRPPSAIQRSQENWSLRVPHENYPTIQSAGVPLPENESGVQRWVELVALQTALCLLRSAEPELADLEFGPPSGRDALSDIVFRMGRPSGQQPGAYPLLVEVKCPWTLSFFDMQQISGPRGEVPLTTSSKANSYNKAQSVLAQVYDYCTKQGHCFWIITTYEYWTFGVFSEDYATAMVTEPIRYDNRSPTTLQCIVYWIQSSTFRAGAFEIPKATEFGIPCSRSLWKETLRIWRENGLEELGPQFTQAGYEDPDWLFATCTASIDKRNQSVPAQDLPGACHEVLRMLGMPNSHLEWTVVLTWLALLLEPISANSELPCLENAFTVASREVAQQPRRHHFGVQERRWPGIHAPRRAHSTAPTIWKAGTALNPVESLKAFFWSHASHEAAFILDSYLPHPIRDTLEHMLDQLQLLSTASQEAQSKGLAIDDASGLEGTPSKHQGITEKARGKCPSVSGWSEKRPASGTSSSLLQGTIAPWKSNTGSGSTAGPSSTQKAQSLGARPSPYFGYRTNSDASLASPATPLARSPRNPSSPFTDSWGTGVSSATPDLLAGEEDDDKVGSLMESLAGLSIKSPGSRVNHSPRNVGKSRLSANNDDGNPFIESATGNFTRSAEAVRDSPKQWSVGLSGEGTNGSAVEDDASRYGAAQESIHSIVEEIRSIALRKYLEDHPYDDVKSFGDLFRQNKVPEATLEVMAGIMGHPFTL